MPKKQIDYAKTVIYKICCNDVSIPDEYVGSTTEAVKRRNKLKSDCTNVNGKNYHLDVYEFIRSRGGWDNWEVVLIEHFPCKSSEEKRARERHWLETLGATLNTNSPIYTHEDTVQRHKKYAVEHAKEISKYKQQRYAANRDEMRKKGNQSYALNREHQRKLVQCECGDEVCHSGLARHKKTAKHAKAMAAI